MVELVDCPVTAAGQELFDRALAEVFRRRLIKAAEQAKEKSNDQAG
ncbi:MAG: hypothetical protein H6Q73_162 [Firmicutes bacterium]|nr:hypothetical protein [Bacillota bacterium]